jgi:hypothetical protein
LMVTPYQAVAQTVRDPHVALTALAACEAETGCQSINQIGGGPGRGPWQIEVGYPGASNYGQISEADANNPTTALAYMLPRFEKAAASIPASLWNSDPKTAAFTAARIAECTNGNPNVPCPNGPSYSASQISGGWARLVQHLGDITGSSLSAGTENIAQSTGGTSIPLFSGLGNAIDVLGSPDTWLRAAFIVLGIGVFAMAGFMIFNNATNGGGNKALMAATAAV